MDDLSLRKATVLDEAFLFDLFCRLRQDDPLQSIAEPARSQLLRVQFLGQQQTYRAAFTDAGHEIVLWEGQPAGRIWVFRGSDEMRLVDISLMPEFQRKGIGTFLLRGLIAEAKAQALPLRASVSCTNEISLRWMQSLGARVVDTVGSFYYALEWDSARRSVAEPSESGG